MTTSSIPRAVIADELGPVSGFRLAENPVAAPQEQAVTLRVHAAGISFVDVLTAAGRYQIKPPVPFIPGSECAGVITAIGSGVTTLNVGDRVSASGWGGMFAESVTLPAASVRAIPDNMSFEEAAVFPVSYATAWYALVQRGALQQGESLLVLGAGGATGYAAVQVGKLLGARVIASASSPEKRALALAGGADAAVDARSHDWRDAVKQANGGKPVDVVFDPVGGAATEPAFRSLGWKGRHLIIGFPSGIAALRTNLPLLKGASLVGVDIRQFGLFEPELSAANRNAIFALAAQRVLVPAIGARYPIEDYEKAMQAAESGALAGRIILTMGRNG